MNESSGHRHGVSAPVETHILALWSDHVGRHLAVKASGHVVEAFEVGEFPRRF